MTEVTSPRSAEFHHAHRDVTGGWLRPAVFGIMDGLGSNFSLVAGVVGGGASGRLVVLSGLAGLAAGACSMASGEFISVSSQADLTRAEIAIEQYELLRNPEDELRELTSSFEAKGVNSELARQVATELSMNHEVRWRVHVREELGIDPDDLPSPWVAATSSFFAFSLGASLPVLPYIFGTSTLLPSVVVSALALIAAGAIVAAMTGRKRWLGALRQLVFGVASAAITYGIGLAVGSAIS